MSELISEQMLKLEKNLHRRLPKEVYMVKISPDGNKVIQSNMFFWEVNRNVCMRLFYVK